jgi:spermidine synthase
VKPVEVLGQQLAPDRTLLKLIRRGDEYSILADNQLLMSSRMHSSEEALATLACENARSLAAPSILVGGLGMGFTLRAALDQLPRQARVVVAELLPAVVEWNRGPHGPLGALAGYPLHDPRVCVEIADVAVVVRGHPEHFDAILLDVDNGPAAFTAPQNSALYDAHGIAAAFAALKPTGTLAVWSAREDDHFAHRLRQANFVVRVEAVRARAGGAATKKGRNRGPRHSIFLARKSPGHLL